MATLRDVAARAGVSVATASRVVSGSAPVRPETRDRVERAMRELLYVPSGAPAATGTIGLVVPGLEDPVVPALVEALEAAATTAGLASFLCGSARSRDRAAEYAHMLLERRVDGIVFVSSALAAPDLGHARLLDRGARIVFVNGRPESVHAPAVQVDERAAGRLAAEHVVALGHAFVGLARARGSGPGRRAGWEAALLEAGLEPEEELVADVAPTVDGGRAAATTLLGGDPRPTAIVCVNDLVAVGVLREAVARGLRVPEELSVVGFDGVAAAWTQPPLTTLEQPVDLIAETAVAALGRMIGQPDAELPDFVFRPRLRAGGTTAPPPDS